MANATINITASDNELYLLAVPASGVPANSYQIAHVQSGNGHGVDVTINISAGTYSEQAMLYGVTGALTATQNVSIPAGTYSVVAIGVNWGREQAYSFSVNGGTPFSFTDSTISPLAVGWSEVVTSAFSVS